MRNLAWMVMVIVSLGCGNSLVGAGSGSSGGHGGLGGAGGGAAGVAGHRGLAGAAGGAAGSTGLPSCLQDLWASCGFNSSQCHGGYDADAGTYPWCSESGASYTGFTELPCRATDGGSVQQVVTPFKKPDGSPCYVLRVDYSEPYPPWGGSCAWGIVTYTLTDATGATIATEGRGTLNYIGGFTCADGGTISCTLNQDGTTVPLCPSIVPYCEGTSGTCPFPRDAGSQ